MEGKAQEHLACVCLWEYPPIPIAVMEELNCRVVGKPEWGYAINP